jgi:hypothetical protein
MLAGTPASFVTTRDPAVFSPSNDALLAGDLDGSTAPPAGAPAPFLMSGTAATWKLWRYHVDFGTPGNSTFTLGGNLTPAGYTELCPTTRSCVPQAGTTSRLDGIGDRGMFRLAYRNFKGYESMVTSQSVEATPGVAGERWYEIRRVNGTYSIHQQGTYAPADGVHRWMGSIAMDKNGDMGLGYSVVNGTNVFPGIRYTERMAADPLGQMTLGEGTIINGSGVQTTTNSRWGDYTDMTVDPVDDCTFWYVNEYYPASGTPTDGRPWHTRIANFKLPGC